MKICPNCSTKNDDGYNFCKECGATLSQPDFEKAPPTYPYVNPYNYERPEAKDYDGVTDAEMQVFVGKNALKIIPKFSKMQISGSKTSWCWPAAILGFLFGFFGLSFWFFYRKMNKVALICVAIGLAIGIAQTAITFNTSVMMYNQMFMLIRNYIQDMDFNAFNEGVDFIVNQFSALPSISLANFLADIENYTAAVLGGIFALGLYKNHAVNKIKQYKNTAITDNYYLYRIELLGGTSGGMVVLGIAIHFTANAIATILPMVIGAL